MVEEEPKNVSKKQSPHPSGANAEISDTELNKLASKMLHSASSLIELKKNVQLMCKKGELGKNQAGQIIRRWRVHERQLHHLEKKKNQMNELYESLESFKGQTLDDVKKMVNEYVIAGKITHHDAGMIVSNWKRSEHRRIQRQMVKQTQKRCLYCRETGHLLADCPSKDEQTMGTGICFKCGSSEHISAKCPRKNIKGYPYAVCFVCKQQGHLSRDCEKNPNGIYPDGGSCGLCGSQKHLKRECPELNISTKGDARKRTGIVAVCGTAMSAGDEDVTIEGDKVDDTTASSSPAKKKSKKKIVRF